MTQRIVAALVAAAVLVGGVATVATSASAGSGDTATVAAKKKKKKKKKKKPPRIAIGTYSGATSNGIPMSLTLNADRTTGTITYCAMVAPISVAGSGFTGTGFSASYLDPNSGDSINAQGTFNAKTRQATGTVLNNGCDSTDQTFTLQAP